VNLEFLLPTNLAIIDQLSHWLLVESPFSYCETMVQRGAKTLGNPLVSAQDANDSPTLLEAQVQFQVMEHVFCSLVQDGSVKS